MEERDEKTLSKRLVTLSRSNKTRSAYELFLSMDASNLKPDSHACNSLLSSLLRNGLLPDALKVFDKMIHSEMATAHSYTLVLKALARIEGCNKALALFHKLEGVNNSTREFDIMVFNTMLSICARVKNWVESEKLWRKLSKSSLKGTLLTYDLLISTFVQCGCAELAFEAYHELVRIRLVPNENILKAIIATSTLEGNWELSLSLLNKMITSNIKPSLITFNSVINCLGKSGHAELAFRVYKILQLNNLQPDIYTINALLSALYRSNRYSKAIKLFQGVKKQGKIKLNLHVYNVVLMIFRKLGFWDRALQLLWEMERTGMEMHTESYNHVIYACEIACEPSVALRVYQHMVQRGCKTDNFTYLPLIRCCISGSFWTDLDEILKGIALDMSLYNTIVHELCSQDKIELARKIHVKMLKIGFKPDEKTKALILKHFRK
ncbi:hypothetical protein LUZ60_005905 [Juncus effusus]|nr:hypothetical protein LUZ60_005905 [Juncus effusus]